jgi:hypothetical protein
MRFSVSLNELDAASRRLAVHAAERADAWVRPAAQRVVVSEDRAPADLGADAWPGAMPAEMPGAAAQYALRSSPL